MKKAALFLLALLLIANTSFALTVYTNDFETNIGTHWLGSTPRTSTDTAITDFLGRLGNQTTTFTYSGLGSGTHNITLTFDFYALNSWDGDDINYGPDHFGISGDYNNEWTVVSPSLGAGTPYNRTATFPFALSESGQYIDENYLSGIYRNITINFDLVGDELNLSFYGEGLQSQWDESWGLDNFRIDVATGENGGSPVPEPSTILLLGSGLLGLGWYGRKRKKA